MAQFGFDLWYCTEYYQYGSPRMATMPRSGATGLSGEQWAAILEPMDIQYGYYASLSQQNLPSSRGTFVL